MTYPPVTLANTQVREIVAAANGARYRISLWTPPGDPPVGGWPMIHVLDANALFATFVETLQRSSRRPDATGIAPAAVVGIAHAEEGLFATERRYRDYTFGPSTLVTTSQAGGGEAFLAFIVDQLAAELGETAPLNASRQAIFGHSLAGYFVLHALMTRPQAFHTCAAISPSIWWDESGLRERLTTLSPQRVRALIAVGEWESSVPPWQRQAPGYERLLQRRRERRMVERAQSMAHDLRARLGTERVAFYHFPEEDHASVLMVAIQRTLRFALRHDEP